MPEIAILLQTSITCQLGASRGQEGHGRAEGRQGGQEGRQGGQEGRQGGQEGRSALLFRPSWNTVHNLRLACLEQTPFPPFFLQKSLQTVAAFDIILVES